MRDKCSTCATAFSEEQRVCHACGTSREAPDNLRTERDSLDELHRAMAAAVHAVKGRAEDTNPVRDRFLQNGFIPSHGDVLVEEALRCQQLFREEVGADSTGPRARYRACLLRLELIAADNPSWKTKVALLRANLEAERVRSRRENIVLATGLISLVVAVGALAVYLAKAIASLWVR